MCQDRDDQVVEVGLGSGGSALRAVVELQGPAGIRAAASGVAAGGSSSVTPPEMTCAVIVVPAAKVASLCSWKARAQAGVLQPSVKRVSSTGAWPGEVIVTLKVFPLSSQSLLTSVTVTFARRPG